MDLALAIDLPNREDISKAAVLRDVASLRRFRPDTSKILDSSAIICPLASISSIDLRTILWVDTRNLGTSSFSLRLTSMRKRVTRISSWVVSTGRGGTC